MEEIEQRLRESTDACIKSFENWVKQSKGLEARESLMETMHEVRKVLARVEIEIAISERERLGSRPIPIPPHRSSRKRSDSGDDAGEYQGGDDGASFDSGDQPGNGEPVRRPQHGRNRRPMQNRERGNGGNGNGNSDNQPS